MLRIERRSEKTKKRIGRRSERKSEKELEEVKLKKKNLFRFSKS